MEIGWQFLVVSEFLRTFAGEMDEMNNNIQDSERLVLRTEGLVKIYGKRTVVNDVSFDVKRGARLWGCWV